MNVLGIEKQDQNEVFRLLMGILYLGNIFFRSGGKDDAHIQDTQGTICPHFLFNFSVVDMFAHLIQSDTNSCSKALCYRTISTGTQGRSARVSTYACPQNVEGVS